MQQASPKEAILAQGQDCADGAQNDLCILAHAFRITEHELAQSTPSKLCALPANVAATYRGCQVRPRFVPSHGDDQFSLPQRQRPGAPTGKATPKGSRVGGPGTRCCSTSARWTLQLLKSKVPLSMSLQTYPIPAPVTWDQRVTTTDRFSQLGSGLL